MAKCGKFLYSKYWSQKCKQKEVEKNKAKEQKK